MSIIAIYSTLISRKPLEIEGTANRKWPMLNRIISHVIYGLTWSWKVKVTIPIRLGPNISKTAGDAV